MRSLLMLRVRVTLLSIGMVFVALLALGIANFGSIGLHSLKFNERATNNVPNSVDGKAASTSVLYADSSSHTLKLSQNNGSYANVVTDAAASIPDSALDGSSIVLSSASSLGWGSSGVSSPDTFLFRGSAGNAIQQRNGTAAQKFAVFNTFTDSSNYERADFDWVVTGNALTFQTSAAGTGTVRAMTIGPAGGSVNLNLQNGGSTRFSILTGGALDPNTDNSTATTLGDTTHRVIAYLSRVITGASTPTASSTGAGTGPTNTVDTGSGDPAGTVTVTAGTTPGNSGTITVTFSTGNGAYGTNAPSCVAMLGNGTGTWNARATVIGGAMSTTSAVFNWDNNAVNLTASSTYKLHYHCWGK